jgi:hypothetical protein
MIIIKHRVNSIEELDTTDYKYGVEIDLRSSGLELIIEHDPFRKGINFFNWLENYHHQLLIINVKEDGLENAAIKIMNEFNISDFFFLDQSFPSLYKSTRIYPQHCSARVSDFESINSALQLNSGWLWFDSHSGDWEYLRKAFSLIADKNVKTCLVSPELQRLNSQTELDNLRSIINDESYEN